MGDLIGDTPNQKTHKLYTLRVGESLFNKIDKHVLLLSQKKEAKYSKQNWIANAIREKIELAKNQPFHVPKVKNLHFKIEKTLGDSVVKNVQLIKKLRKSFSSKLWILEAIHEKLEREESEAKTILENLEKE